MLIFTNDPIDPASSQSDRALAALPFQPGELYAVRYMSQPTLVTVLARDAKTVKVWFDTLTAEAFNERVLFRLGRRGRFLGRWMPWAVCQPERAIHCDLADSLGTDRAFWIVRN